MKQISLEEIEKAAEQVFGDYPYPRQIGEGLWEVAPGVIGGEKFLEMFTKAVKDSL